VQAINKVSAENLEILAKTLFRIHNGKTIHPVVLLCGGLGTSIQAFRRLQISRFRDDCVVNLGRLPEVNERAIIRDWLVKDGGAREKDIAPWIQIITRETHGWQQHIVMYARAAAEILEVQKGKMTLYDLDAVLKRGREKKRIYYDARCHFLSVRDIDSTKALVHAVRDTQYSRGVQRDRLLKRMRKAGNLSKKQAKKLFGEALDYGVLSNAGTASFLHYDIPIPPLRDYLFDLIKLVDSLE